MSDKMSNTKLRNAINELNKQTGNNYAVNSWEFGDKGKTQYGLMKVNKDKTMDVILESGYNKREIYYHIQGYLILNRDSVSTGVTSIPKKSKKNK